MLMNTWYDEVIKAMPDGRTDRTIGLTTSESHRAIKKLGGAPYTLINEWSGVPGILTVPSLNNAGRLHVVYVDEEGSYWDPNVEFTGRQWYYNRFKPMGMGMTVNLKHEYSRDIALVEYNNSKIMLGGYIDNEQE